MRNIIIGAEAFNSCGKLQNVTIPNSVVKLDDYAFMCCSNLKSLTLPSSVTAIGAQTFVGCSSLKTAAISKSVTSVGDLAFSNCAPNFTIYGDACSYIHKYTRKYGIPFVVNGTDINNDSIINIKDLSSISKAYGAKSGGTSYQAKLDFNNDKIIDIFDLVVISEALK